jgi:hypothetical protein
MSYFAKVSDGVVVKVIAASQEFFDTFVDSSPGEWIETSIDGEIRKQYAGVGYTYDASADVFIQPQPYSSWTLDENHDWQPPTPKPDGRHTWNEETQAWDQIDD